MNLDNLEPLNYYDGSHRRDSQAWLPMPAHPGYGVGRLLCAIEPEYAHKNSSCYACKASCRNDGVELAFTIGALDEYGWHQQGDICRNCASKLTGNDQPVRPLAYAQGALL